MHHTVICNALSMERFETDAVEDDFEGLKLFEENHHDVVFLNLEMPTMNGLDSLHAFDGIPRKQTFPS